jgi:hypothetical protein
MYRRTAYLAAALTCFTAACNPAVAEGGLEAQYSIALTGIPIGRSALVLELTNNNYTTAGSATVTGILKLVSPGKGSAASRGSITNGKILPISYSLTSESGERWEDIRMAIAAGVVRDFTIMPPPSYADDRVPITDEHRKGVVDPMSAMIMPVPGSGDVLSAETCNRTLSIFDGRQRYDLVMSYERSDIAKDVKGYSGPLVVCRIAYRPLAGHRPNRAQVKYMVENQNIFIWLAPVAGTRVLVPVRVTVATMLGTLVVQATHFSSERRARPAVSPAAKK